MRRARRALRRIVERFGAERDLLATLHGSAAWRTLAPLLRAWMAPARLGRGRTILDDLAAARDDTRAALAELEDALTPCRVRVELAEPWLAQRFDVSVLVTNWNGAEDMEAFLASHHRHHGAEAAELVIVDHASEDDSVARVRAWMDRLPIQLLRCDRNQRFAVANNLARRHARGSVLVFANNDVVFDSPVLPALIMALDEPEVGLAGVPLWYPGSDGARSDRLQHAGIRFAPDPDSGFLRPYNVQDGFPAALENGAAPVASVTAALAACRAEDFDAVGGFVEDYDYGFEDVDLALALQFLLGRRVVLCTDVGALHAEFGSQRRQDDRLLEARRARNADLLRDRQGAALARRVFRSQAESAMECGETGRGEIWHARPLAVRLPPARDAAARRWPGADLVSAAALEPGAPFAGVWLMADPEDYLASPPTPAALTVAMVSAGSADAWLAAPGSRKLDLMLCEDAAELAALCSASRATCLAWPEGRDPLDDLARLARTVGDFVERPGIALKLAVTEEAERETWGDFHFAEALGRALRDRGWRVRIDLRPDWDSPRCLPEDVTLALRGLESPAPREGALNLAWLISHPQRVADDELERFDHVFVASEAYAALLGERLHIDVSCLLQCTDPARFPFVEVPGAPERVLFVGNAKGYYRPIVRAALAGGHAPEIWGTWWHEHIDPALIRGENVPNDRLGALYGDSGVVLNDHWPDMARLGFLSNRLFDAAATGALVVTDPVRGLETVFGGAVLVADELPERLPDWSGAQVRDRGARRGLAEDIAARHTFAARAAEIDRLVRRRRPGLFQPSSPRASD